MCQYIRSDETTKNKTTGMKYQYIVNIMKNGNEIIKVGTKH